MHIIIEFIKLFTKFDDIVTKLTFYKHLNIHKLGHEKLHLLILKKLWFFLRSLDY